MIVYGRNPVREALRGRRAQSVRDVWATSAAAREGWLGELSPRITAALEIADRCGSDAHQGVCAEAGEYPYVPDEELLSAGDAVIVVLDELSDPQNLGSICRTCECAGARGVVIPERRAAEVTPAVCKASAGAVEHLALARTRNIADFIARARDAGFWCYGASADAVAARDGARERAPVAYDAPDYRGAPVALVLGSEGRGLRPRVASACDELIALPMRGRVASLGVAAAGAAILYEILQNREQGVDNSP
ncbi:MAG TPA: RNA methyltransferase [Solirubrobacteraceae bacterium]|nr:RNA methyltransferase [Solirubrobacteraceae bacterium]